MSVVFLFDLIFLFVSTRFGALVYLFIIYMIILTWALKRLTIRRSCKKEFKEFQENQCLTIHMVSETEYVTQGQGVHTAYVEMLQLLDCRSDVKLITNNHGRGHVFHSHTYGPYYFFKGIGYKGRRILTAHVIPESSRGTIPFWKILYPLTSLYLKMAYAYADVIIAISPTVEHSIKSLGVKSDIVRIYNPVLQENWARTAENRARGRRLLNISASEQVIMGVGQLQERKGVEDFIDMAAAMPERRFVWVGGRPWGIFTEGISRIDARIENAPSNITFTGLKPLSDMPEMYAAADLFIFSSYQENCPLAPLEAASAGLPVIFRDIPEYESLFTKPYLKASTTTDFITLANELLSNNESYETAVSLSKYLIQDFDKEEIRVKLIHLYQGVFYQFCKRHHLTPNTDQGSPDHESFKTVK